MKIMEIVEFQSIIRKNENLIILLENHENHGNRRIPCDNHENNENIRIPLENNECS